MYHVEMIDIRKKNTAYGYADYACLAANNMENVSNFYVRNLMTGLRKPEKERTPNEKEVIRIIEESVPVINKKLKDKYDLKVSNIRKDKKLSRAEQDKKIRAVKRQQYSVPTAEKWFVGYGLLDAVFKYTDNADYRSHHSHVMQNAIKSCESAWKSFFKQPAEGNGLGKKKIPGYKKSGGRSTAIFSNKACRIDHGQLKFPLALLPETGKKQRLVLEIGKLPHASKDKLIEVRIVPYFDRYQVQIITDDGLSEEDLLPKEEDIIDSQGRPAGVMMLDPGLKNFATITDNKGNTPIIIKGGAIKSRNQWFNKIMSRMRSELMKGHDPKAYHPPTTKRMQAISRKRDAFLRDTFYKYAHMICRIMEKRDLRFLIVGHNKGQKNGVCMGHENNQHFVGIPFMQFNHILETVALKYGIRVILQEESYTSKSCFAAGDPIPTYGEKDSIGASFSGKRIKRGLYRDCNGMILNADVNGSANIGRKYHPDIFKGQADISYLYGHVAAYKHTDIIPKPKAAKKYSR